MLKKHWQLLLAILIAIHIIVRASEIRWMGYDIIPKAFLDEYNYVWQALSLKSTGLPVGWVTFEHLYRTPNSLSGNIVDLGIRVGSPDNPVVDLDNFKKQGKTLIAVRELDWGDGTKHLFFVAPFFDHPPLGGIIFSQSVDKSVNDFADVKPDQFRRPAVYIAIISSFLLFILVYLVTNLPWVATLSVAFYSSVPTYLLSSRIAILENAVPPFALLHLILLTIYLRFQERFTKKITYLILFLSGFAGGLATMAKESAIGFVIGSVALILITGVKEPLKKSKVLLTIIIGAALPVAWYIIWGLSIHSKIFLEILATNASRISYGPLKLVSTLPALRFKDFPVDGWWLWGFVSFFLCCLYFNRKYLPLILPFTAHFLLVLFLASPNYPWYYLAMIPFLASFTAINLWNLYKTPNIAHAVAFFLIPLSSSFYWGRLVFKGSSNLWDYKITFIVFMVFVFLKNKFTDNKKVKIVWTIFFIVLTYYLVKLNFQSIQFIIANWGKLPIESLPNF